MRKFLLLFFISSLSLSVFAQRSLPVSKAWNLFYRNKADSARILFESEIAQDPGRSEAYLGLAMLNENENYDLSPVRYFHKFYQHASAPDPYLYALWGSNEVHGSNYINRKEEELNFFKELANSAKTESSIRAMANGFVGNCILYAGQSSEESYFGKIGSIRDWDLLGEFQNISSSGFDKQPGGIADSVMHYKNKRGAAVTWFHPAAWRKDCWVDLEDNYNTHNSIVFARTYVQSQTDQTVQFRLGVSGSVKAWLNDQEIINEPEERNNDLDTYGVEVHLHKGFNRILLQLGESYAGRMNFMLRLTNDSGDPIENLSTSVDPQPYVRESGTKPVALPFFAEKFFKEAIAKKASDPLNYLMLSQVYLQQDKIFEATQILKEVEKLIPSCSYLRLLFNRLYLKERNTTFALRELERVKSQDPGNPVSQFAIFQDLIKAEQYQQAEAMIPQVLKSTRSTTREVLKLMVEIKSGDKKEIAVLIDSIYAHDPENAEFVQARYYVDANLRNNESAAIEVLKKYLKNHFNWDFLQTVASIYIKQNHFEEGMRILKAAESRFPNRAGIFEKQAEYYYGAHKYEDAIKSIEYCLSLAPNSTWYYADLGFYFQASGDKEKSIAAYTKSIEYYPGNFSSIKALRKLKQEPDVFSLFKEEELSEILNCTYTPDTAQSYGSVFLHREEQKVIFTGGTSEERYSYVVRILNKSGLDYWKELAIDNDGASEAGFEKAEIIKPNGNKIPAEVNDEKAVFTNLEVGDAIHVIYKKEIVPEGKLAPYFWDKYYFSVFIPSLSVQYQLLVPADQKFSYQMTRSSLQPVESTEGNFRKYVWKTGLVKAVEQETAMPALSDVGSALYVSSIPSWTFVSNWYNDLASSRARIDFSVREVADSIFRNKHSQSEKIKAIYDYISSNITYSFVSFRQSGLIPQKPSDVIHTRIGDCKDVSTLFITLCKAGGIRAHLLLVDTHDNGKEDMILPSIDFNHCMAKVEADGHTYQLELTSNTLPFASLPASELHSSILEISDLSNTGQLDDLNPAERTLNQKIRKGRLRIEGSDLKLEQTHVFTGAMASALREYYREKASKEQEKQLEKTLSENNEDAKIEFLKFSDLNELGDEANYKIKYRIHDAVTKVGPVQFFIIPWSDKADLSDFNLNEIRLYPLDLSQLNFADVSSQEYEIDLPPNTKLSDLPKSQTLSCKNADYKITYIPGKQMLRCIRKLTIRKMEVPKEDIGQFFAFYRAMIKADHEKLIISR